jgi:hypothetical protein
VPRQSNIFFDDDHLAIAVGLGQRTVLAMLDTGAQTTDLYAAFAKEFASLLSETGQALSSVVWRRDGALQPWSTAFL